MRPLNYAILKLYEDGSEIDVQGVISRLEADYSSFSAFKPKAVNESLMSAEKNGMLEECNWELDDKGVVLTIVKPGLLACRTLLDRKAGLPVAIRGIIPAQKGQ